MRTKLERDNFDSHLPTTQCKQELRQKLDQMHLQTGISRGNIIRYAVELFLESNLKEIQATAKQASVQP